MTKTKLLSGTIIISLAVTLQPAFAQDGGIEEIFVTAQKRQQSQQDVGISITALSGDAIEQLNFQDSESVAAQTPGAHCNILFWR